MNLKQFLHSGSVIILGAGLTLFVSACSLINRISVVDDRVSSSKIVRFDNTYYNHSRRSPMLYQNQSLIREIRPDGKTTTAVYDILALTLESFRIEPVVYLLTDKEVISIKLSPAEPELNSNFNPQSLNRPLDGRFNTLMASGNIADNKRFTMINFELTPAIIEKIKETKKLSFRYYAGPHSITSKVSSFDLKKIKKVLQIN